MFIRKRDTLLEKSGEKEGKHRSFDRADAWEENKNKKNMDAIIKIATDALARIRMLFSWEDGQAIPWFGWMKI
jgi:hypothetical protein